MLSTILETEQGNWRVLCVYMGGILGGSLAASIFEESPMVGASSGVYSLLLSHIPHIIMVNIIKISKVCITLFVVSQFQNFSMISHRYFRIVCVMVLCLSDISYSIRHCILQGNLQPKIGIAAHVAGAISGILLGFIFYKNLHSSKVMIHRATKWISMILVTCWIAVTIFYNIKYNKEHL